MRIRLKNGKGGGIIKDKIMTIEELKHEANKLSIEDLEELAGFCDDLRTCLEQERDKG
jgi:hypothetical protein